MFRYDFFLLRLRCVTNLLKIVKVYKHRQNCLYQHERKLRKQKSELFASMRKSSILPITQWGAARISAQSLHNRAVCEESTILTECVDFYTSMNIKYGGI